MGMDHGRGGMDHDMPGMGDDQPMCSMNMIFTWDYNNLCIVFRWWRITGPLSLAISLLAIVALCAGYEGIREISRRYESRHGSTIDAYGTSSSSEHESDSLLGVGKQAAEAERKGNLIRAGLYAFQVFYSLMVMLLFMTYNGYVMMAVTVGAFVGYLTFGTKLSATKTGGCH